MVQSGVMFNVSVNGMCYQASVQQLDLYHDEQIIPYDSSNIDTLMKASSTTG